MHFIIVMIRWTGLAPWEFELDVTVVNQKSTQWPVAQILNNQLTFAIASPPV